MVTIIRDWRKESLSNLKMELFIMDNGEEVCDVGLEFKSGLMELNMRGSGIMAKQMVEVNLLMSTVMYMRAIGEMIKLVDMEFISIIMVPSTKDSGLMTISTEKELNHGLMEVGMMEITNKEKRMEKENILGKTEVTLLVNGKIIR